MSSLLLVLSFSTSPAQAWEPPALPACSNVALLVQHDYAYVQTNICTLCGPVSSNYCEFDWPSNDVMACSDLDTMRNSIYAYYGRPFSTDKWKNYFAGQEWYKVNPDYSDALLSEAAKRNVVLLKNYAEQGTICIK